MEKNIEIQKLKSEYPEFFEKFPAELLDFIFSEKTSSKIAQICSESGIEDEDKIEKIAYQITLVLLKQMLKENLAEALQKQVYLDSETAKKISAKANLFIFYDLKKDKKEEAEGERGAEEAEKESYQEEKLEDETIQQTESYTLPEEKTKKFGKTDTYREPTE